MAINKLTVLLPLTLMMLGASAAPVSPAADVSSGSVEKRGYDGDWLYSREAGEALKATYKNIAEGKVVVVNGEVQIVEKRGYDGDWLYSRRNAEAKETGVDAEK